MAEVHNRLSKLHDIIQKVKKDSRNPHFDSGFTSLEGLLDAIRAPLKEVGLDFYQGGTAASYPGAVAITTSVFCTGDDPDGNQVHSVLEMPLAKKDGHAVGSAITYARRYSLEMALGLKAGVDDDANACSIVNPVPDAKRKQLIKAYKNAKIELQEDVSDPLSQEDYDRLVEAFKAAKALAGKENG